jgi:hypothetical protein
VAALVTLPEATGDLLEDGAGASPDLERVMATTQAKAGKTVRNKSGQRKKRKKNARNKTKASYRAPGDSRAEKIEENGEANQAKTKVTA